MLRPWLPVALTALVVLVLESSVGIWPSDRFGTPATRVIGGWAGLVALGLVWTAGIVISLARSFAGRDPAWALAAAASSLAGLWYFPDWARRVALPTQGGISPHEVLEGMFPFVGHSALSGLALVSLLALGAAAFATARERARGVSASASGAAPPRG